MRKKLDTRFPAARIKKIMQADEDVGKIAMAVPLLVSKALELFLKDLCEQTYDITLKKGAKTMNALHLKQCVHGVNTFDFLKDVVRNVPDLGNSDAAVDDHNIAKRRKAPDVDDSDSGKESNMSRMHETAHAPIRGRGRGRPRGRGRGSRVVEREMSTSHQNHDDDPYSDYCNHLQGDGNGHEHQKEKIPADGTTETPVHDFDLNMDLDENGELKTTSRTTSADPSVKLTLEMKHGDLPGWSFTDIEKMDVDPIHLAYLNGKADSEDEDYDEEG